MINTWKTCILNGASFPNDSGQQLRNEAKALCSPLAKTAKGGYSSSEGGGWSETPIADWIGAEKSEIESDKWKLKRILHYIWN